MKIEIFDGLSPIATMSNGIVGALCIHLFTGNDYAAMVPDKRAAVGNRVSSHEDNSGGWVRVFGCTANKK